MTFEGAIAPDTLDSESEARWGEQKNNVQMFEVSVSHVLLLRPARSQFDLLEV